MVLGGSIGRTGVPSSEGGRRSYRNICFILYKQELFQFVVNQIEIE